MDYSELKVHHRFPLLVYTLDLWSGFLSTQKVSIDLAKSSTSVRKMFHPDLDQKWHWRFPNSLWAWLFNTSLVRFLYFDLSGALYPTNELRIAGTWQERSDKVSWWPSRYHKTSRRVLTVLVAVPLSTSLGFQVRDSFSSHSRIPLNSSSLLESWREEFGTLP